MSEGEYSVARDPFDFGSSIDVYKVQLGDTLSKLVKDKYGVTNQDLRCYIRAIADYNGIEDPDLIYIGQVIGLPSVATIEYINQISVEQIADHLDLYTSTVPLEHELNAATEILFRDGYLNALADFDEAFSTSAMALVSAIKRFEPQDGVDQNMLDYVLGFWVGGDPADVRFADFEDFAENIDSIAPSLSGNFTTDDAYQDALRYAAEFFMVSKDLIESSLERFAYRLTEKGERFPSWLNNWRGKRVWVEDSI